MKRCLLLLLIPGTLFAKALVVRTPQGEFVRSLALDDSYQYELVSDLEAQTIEDTARRLEAERAAKAAAIELPSAPSGNAAEDTTFVDPATIVLTDTAREYINEYRELIERHMPSPPQGHCVVKIELSSYGRVLQARVLEGYGRSCDGIIPTIHSIESFPLPKDPQSIPAARSPSIAFSPRHG
uniref:cell envelope integrity protein TolA n=1 Tax=Thaumasiovibrio occultus TaxID=1891184 RepID=UPI000B360C6E|nr:cell envelope integrity protein TolA [Thaumasiovibrio occultus]